MGLLFIIIICGALICYTFWNAFLIRNAGLINSPEMKKALGKIRAEKELAEAQARREQERLAQEEEEASDRELLASLNKVRKDAQLKLPKA